MKIRESCLQNGTLALLFTIVTQDGFDKFQYVLQLVIQSGTIPLERWCLLWRLQKVQMLRHVFNRK